MTTTGAPEVFGLPEEPASSEEESSSSSKKYLRGKHNKESDSDSESESEEKEEPSLMNQFFGLSGLSGASPQDEELPQLGGGGMPSFTI